MIPSTMLNGSDFADIFFSALDVDNSGDLSAAEILRGLALCSCKDIQVSICLNCSQIPHYEG